VFVHGLQIQEPAGTWKKEVNAYVENTCKKGKNIHVIDVCFTDICDRVTNCDVQYERESCVPYTIGYCEVAGMRFRACKISSILSY
jgi:hypothetical protein